MFRIIATAGFLALTGLNTESRAGSVTTYFNQAAWQQELMPATAIDFTGWPGVPVGRTITEQYSHLGIHFTDGNDFILNETVPPPAGMFPDFSGLHGGSNGQINIAFDSMQYGFAIHAVGTVQLRLYQGGVEVYSSPNFSSVGSYFVGFTFAGGFDGVRITDPWDPVVIIDNLYFAVPGPGALGVFALGAILGRTRRRGE